MLMSLEKTCAPFIFAYHGKSNKSKQADGNFFNGLKSKLCLTNY